MLLWEVTQRTTPLHINRSGITSLFAIREQWLVCFYLFKYGLYKGMLTTTEVQRYAMFMQHNKGDVADTMGWRNAV